MTLPSGLFRGNTFFLLVYFSNPFTEWSKKLPILSWAKNKRKVCSRSRLLGKQLCHFVHVIQRTQWLLKLRQCQRRMLLGAASPYMWLWCRPLGFHSKTLPCLWITTPFWEIALGLLLGLSREWTLNHGPPSYHVTGNAQQSWVLSGSPSHKLGHVQLKLCVHSYTPSTNSMIYSSSCWEALKAQVTWRSIPKDEDPHPAMQPFLPTWMYGFTGNPLINWQRNRRSRPGVQMMCTIAGSTWKWML